MFWQKPHSEAFSKHTLRMQNNFPTDAARKKFNYNLKKKLQTHQTYVQYFATDSLKSLYVTDK